MPILIGVVLVAWCFGCGSRVLGGPVERRDAGAGGSGGDQADGGRGGSDGPGGAGGRGGTGGPGGDGGRGGTAASGGAGGAGGDPCVITCGANPCPVRAGEPRVVVTSPFEKQILAIAVSADTLYWGTYPNQTEGEIRSMPLAGGPSKLLAQNVIVSDLYLDGSTLYYVTNDRAGGASLAVVAAAGGIPQVIAKGAGFGSLTSDASGIYFGVRATSTSAAPGASRIMRVDRAGTGVTPVVEVTGTLWGFAVDDTNVYWAAYWNGGALSRRSLAGGDTTTLRASSAPITSPVVDGEDLLFVEGISTPDVCQSAIWSVPKIGAGGVAPRLISPGTSGIDVFRPVRDGTHLYWARSSRQGAILRTVKGQTPELLAADQRSVGALTLGPTDVYWIAGTGSSYEVRTLPK
jgi:hypothetical protein